MKNHSNQFQQQNREYGLDCFRLLAFVFITILHVVNQRYCLLNSSRVDLYILGNTLENVAFCGVDCFAVLSGYLLGKRKIEIDQSWLKRIGHLWIQCLFFSLAIYLLFILFNRQQFPFSIKDFIKFSMPISYGNWWYINAYLGVLALSPIINYFINTQKIKNRIVFGFALFIFFSIIPTVFFMGSFWGLNWGYSTIWLVVCYYLGAMIKLDEDKLKLEKIPMRFFGIAAGLSFSMPLVWYFGFDVLNISIMHKIFLMYFSPFCVLDAILLLLIFKRIRIQSRILQRFLVGISSASLGIYLFHTHGLIWRKFIVDGVLNHSSFIGIFFIVCRDILLICVAGIVFDLMRQGIFKLCQVDRFENWLCNVIFCFAGRMKNMLIKFYMFLIREA